MLRDKRLVNHGAQSTLISAPDPPRNLEHDHPKALIRCVFSLDARDRIALACPLDLQARTLDPEPFRHKSKGLHLEGGGIGMSFCA